MIGHSEGGTLTFTNELQEQLREELGPEAKDVAFSRSQRWVSAFARACADAFGRRFRVGGSGVR